jgi:indolepyruvate ferredoxin oxidoreductase, alpha subunit
MAREVLLGDEAVALGAIHAGITTGYAYPGTPSTEIFEYLINNHDRKGKPFATWCTNEKTSYESALGSSVVGRRTLVAMKHVGLNVAADPFMNSALVNIHGGLVVVVADDPGQHSSQNEQDSRLFADMAKTICLEPANGQEAYEMTRQAFDLSEQFKIPVVIRLVTRLAHSRSPVETTTPLAERPFSKAIDINTWNLLPATSRKQWKKLLSEQDRFEEFSCQFGFNNLTIDQGSELGVITTGTARNYFLETIDEMEVRPTHLHIASYPIPRRLIRELAESCQTILVIEEGYSFVERMLRGILPSNREILGQESGQIPTSGELTTDVVRAALKLESRPTAHSDFVAPTRPPQLCQGCPHIDSYQALSNVLKEYDNSVVTSDIGCYTLGAIPPYTAIETCLCMGASIGMARGAADGGMHPAVATIGDSTFLHSGITPLIDAADANTNMTVIILDNSIVAMTGGQKTILSSERLREVVKGVLLGEDQITEIYAHKRDAKENEVAIKKAIDYEGLSVIIAKRECIHNNKK